MNKNELKNLPALPSLALAAMGLVLLVTGLAMPWFKDNGNLWLFAKTLTREEFPVLPAELFALLSAACTLASLVLLFIPGKERAQKGLFIARCVVSGAAMLFSLLALVLAVVYAALCGISTHAGPYLSLIGTVTVGVALLLKRISKRRLIQVYAALLANANIAGFAGGPVSIYAGATKYACVPGLNCYSCPGAVGACPLGALQNAFANSGTRAPYYVIGILALLGILLGRTVCGFLCPVGLGQELLYKIKTPKLQKSRYTRILSYLKYVFLAIFVIVIPIMYGMGGAAVPAFCKYICPAGTFGGGVALLFNPNNAEYFGLTEAGGMLGPLFTWKFALFCVIAAACVFIFRAFCRFICPLGAIYGFFNKIALLGVKLDKNKCTDCGLCVQKCKMDIKRVGDHECINCGECIPACPAKAISWKGASLFVHENAIAPVPVEEKPLSSLLQPAPVSANSAPISAISAAPSAPSAPSAPAPAPAQKKGRKTGLALRITAYALAFLLFLGGFLYYNVFAAESVSFGFEAGDRFSDFKVETADGKTEKFYKSVGGRTAVLVVWDGADPSLIRSVKEAQETFFAEYPQFEEESALYAVSAEIPEGAATEELLALGVTPVAENEGGALFAALEEKEIALPVAFVLDETHTILTIDDGTGTQAERVNTVKVPFTRPQIGYLCPDFTLPRYGYGENGTYALLEETVSLSALRGQVVVVNFWGTWCGPCIAELPDFNRAQEEHPEITIVAIQGKADQPVPEFITDKMKWADYSLTFLQDTVNGDTCETFVKLGGARLWPYTLIVDGDGIVSFKNHGSLTYEKLIEQIEAAKA